MIKDSVKLIDKKILSSLQRDVSRSLSEISKDVNLSNTPCWNRIKKLQNRGYIKSRVALLEPKKINLGVTAFIFLSVGQHTPEELKKFVNEIEGRPEVTSFYRVSGDYDYILKVQIESIEKYDEFSQELIGSIKFTNFTTSFCMSEIKDTTELPLKYL